LDKILSALASLGSGALLVVVGAVALYLGNKFYQRHRLLRELQTARITVDELYQKQETGENPIILDLRSQAEVERDPALIRSARHITMEQLKASQDAIPHDKDIILYCSCPNEVSSARMALMLQRNGILKVRPLVGGLDAWRERKYPTELHVLGTAKLPDLVKT
jgi:rhodanese-related sulfurtransferase